MAPCARLAEKLRKLGLSTDDAGPSTSGGGGSACAPRSHHHAGGGSRGINKPQLTFSVYFPLPPFDGVHFNALKAGSHGYNFTGQLLGVGGRQLQRIKQESNARVEVVNAQGNLNGAHPDPLDKQLHAHITADSLAKLKKAVTLVWELLSPTNAKFEPIAVVPGGSARLTVVRPLPAAVSKAALKSKHGKAAARPVPAARPSLDGDSASSSSGKGMPASPALTPVTPGAMHGGHSSMFTAPSGPGSHTSSRAATPQHGGSSLATAAEQAPAGSHSNPNNSSSLDGFSLPPAAVPPAAPTTPLASEEEWPALPSAGASSKSGNDNNNSNSCNSSSNTVEEAGAKRVVRQLSILSTPTQTGSSNNNAPSHEAGSLGSSSSSMCAAADMPGATETAADAAHEAVPVDCFLKPVGIKYEDTTSSTHAGCDASSTSHSMPSPLTPHAGQQAAGQACSAGLDCSADCAKACFGRGGSDNGGCTAPSAWAGLSARMGFSGCAGFDSSHVNSNSSGTDDTLAPQLTGPDQQHAHYHYQQPTQQQQCALDLVALRQRAGLVSQACLQGGDLLSSSPLMCGAGDGGLLAPSAGCSLAAATAGPWCSDVQHASMLAVPSSLPLPCTLGVSGVSSCMPALLGSSSSGGGGICASLAGPSGLLGDHSSLALAGGAGGAAAAGPPRVSGDASSYLASLEQDLHHLKHHQHQAYEAGFAAHHQGASDANLASSWDARHSQVRAVAAAASSVFGAPGGSTASDGGGEGAKPSSLGGVGLSPIFTGAGGGIW